MWLIGNGVSAVIFSWVLACSPLASAKSTMLRTNDRRV